MADTQDETEDKRWRCMSRGGKMQNRWIKWGDTHTCKMYALISLDSIEWRPGEHSMIMPCLLPKTWFHTCTTHAKSCSCQYNRSTLFSLFQGHFLPCCLSCTHANTHPSQQAQTDWNGNEPRPCQSTGRHEINTQSAWIRRAWCNIWTPIRLSDNHSRIISRIYRFLFTTKWSKADLV